MRSELDFGIMCNGSDFDDWQAECISELRELDEVNLKLLIIDDSGTPSTGGLSENILNLLKYRNRTSSNRMINKTAWWLYNQLFDNPQCKFKVDLSDELESIDRISCDVEEDGFSQYFYKNDIERIKNYDLDFILRMGFGIIRGEILQVPEYGVWSYHHDDERKYRGRPACFWEPYNGDPVTGAVLQRLTDRLDGGIILKRGAFQTRRAYNDNVNNVYYGTTEWPTQVAIDILNGNGGYINSHPTSSDAPIYQLPSPLQILSYQLNKWNSLATTALTGTDHWNIGVIKDPIQRAVEEKFNPEIEWYPYHKKDGYIADPFSINISGQTYIFVEEFSYPEGKGKISYIEYPDGFQNGDLRTAHVEPEHLSYPYLFNHDDTVYATPEIHESGEIRLYEVHSPVNWEFKSTLINSVGGNDPTIIKHKDKWWIFYTEQAYRNTKLHIQFAESLTGEWKPHKQNPVKTDIRSSRPGGTPFVRENELYRPAQNSASGYGKKIAINKVEKLTPEQYIEKNVNEIQPSEESSYTGMHTLSSQGDLTFIDGKKSVRNRYAIQRRATEIVSRLSI
jgi:hypothetical protein